MNSFLICFKLGHAISQYFGIFELTETSLSQEHLLKLPSSLVSTSSSTFPSLKDCVISETLRPQWNFLIGVFSRRRAIQMGGGLVPKCNGAEHLFVSFCSSITSISTVPSLKICFVIEKSLIAALLFPIQMQNQNLFGFLNKFGEKKDQSRQ